MLDTLKSTMMRLDGLPDWFIRLAAPGFAQPLTYLFNLTLQQSLVTHQWKSSPITPSPLQFHLSLKALNGVLCHVLLRNYSLALH